MAGELVAFAAEMLTWAMVLGAAVAVFAVFDR